MQKLMLRQSQAGNLLVQERKRRHIHIYIYTQTCIMYQILAALADGQGNSLFPGSQQRCAPCCVSLQRYAIDDQQRGWFAETLAYQERAVSLEAADKRTISVIEVHVI